MDNVIQEVTDSITHIDKMYDICQIKYVFECFIGFVRLTVAAKV
jgi:hypothetical protein